MKTSSTCKMVCFCIALVIIRIIGTDQFSFLFLFWNLFLAWLPYYFIKKFYNVSHRPEQLMVVGLSILFLPNAPYILTDLFHLRKNLVAPQWFDLILILSFSVTGLIYFIKTCDLLFQILKVRIQSTIIYNCVRLLIIISNGYGIYLGRYLRFNSWDIISNPDELLKKMLISVFHPDHFKETFAVTITFTVFLYLILELYESLKNDRIREINDVSKRS